MRVRVGLRVRSRATRSACLRHATARRFATRTVPQNSVNADVAGRSRPATRATNSLKTQRPALACAGRVRLEGCCFFELLYATRVVSSVVSFVQSPVVFGLPCHDTDAQNTA